MTMDRKKSRELQSAGHMLSQQEAGRQWKLRYGAYSTWADQRTRVELLGKGNRLPVSE